MPKQIVAPIPAYGSAEWKAERAKMVGTPEWKVANNRATLDETVTFKSDEYIRDWVDSEISQGKDRPTAAQIAAKRTEIEPGFRKTYGPSANAQDQKMMTGANILTRINEQGVKESYYGVNPLRQDAPHSELYNRLLQSGGMKEGAPVDPWSLGGKYNPGPQIQNPNAPATTPNVQMPNPGIQTPTKGPDSDGVFRPFNPNAPANPVNPQASNINTSNLSQAYQGQNQSIPSLTAPVSGPNLPNNPLVKLPDQFKQNYGGPTSNPAAIPNGITMPNWNGGQKAKSGFGGNWNDLLSVAHNRYTR